MRQIILSAIPCLCIASSSFAQARVVITEIMYNPASNEKKNEAEWVEIANIGNEAAVIKDWRLALKDKKTRWGKFSCTLAPGEVAVIINGEAVKEEQFREAWDVSSESATASQALKYQVIAVKWGGLANNAEHAVRLLNEKDEVMYEQSGKWPRVPGAGGPSIFLSDVNASADAEDAWRITVIAMDGGRHNKVTDIFDKPDLASPGYVPGINGNPAASTPVTVIKKERSKPDETKENEGPPQDQQSSDKSKEEKPKDDQIDY